MTKYLSFFLKTFLKNSESFNYSKDFADSGLLALKEIEQKINLIDHDSKP